MTIQTQLYNGMWDEAKNTEHLLDMVLARETWFAPRVNREPMTTHEQVINFLGTGETISFSDYWYANIRMTPEPVVRPAAEMVHCSCGHDCPRSQRMSTSRGTSCPYCYDRMSN